MDHEEAYSLIEAYAFGTLDEAEAREVEKHLDAGCLDCASRLREAAELSATIAEELPPHIPPDHVKKNILIRI